MYNSSRGILYTAPPAPDETNEKRGDDAAAETEADTTADATATDDAATAVSGERANGLAADD